jgi:hypothetical protein
MAVDESNDSMPNEVEEVVVAVDTPKQTSAELPSAAGAAASGAASVSDALPTLYTSESAPNPRRVHIFLAEMGFEDLVQYKQVDLRKGESRSEELLKINPTGGIPVLVVPGQATGIAESVAICRYLVCRTRQIYSFVCWSYNLFSSGES